MLSVVEKFYSSITDCNFKRRWLAYVEPYIVYYGHCTILLLYTSGKLLRNS